MPESYDREGLIDRATDAINGGESTRALEIAEEIRKGEGPNADEALIRGIALSSLGRTAEASDAFAEATRRAPQSHKARFNAAVHEFNVGNLEGARVLADEALALDRAHSATRQLVEKIAQHGKPVVEEPPLPSDAGVALSTEAYPRSLNDDEALPWVGRLGARWISIAIVIAMVSFLSFVAITAMSFPYIASLRTGAGMAEGIEAGMTASRSLQRNPAYETASLVSFFAGVAAVVWTLLDLVRRQGNFLWLLGIVPLSCFSCGWLVLPLYLLLGRKS